ncbi:MAG: alpha/beta hydrolase [Simkaniaceae bacterium]|nr:alpha/beta hydrolase [Simkaniaceae bacterium]
MSTFIYYFVVMGAFILWKSLRKRTPPFSHDGLTENNSIAEELFLELGGVKQWILLRGKDYNNPILIYLQGGPGNCTHGLFRYHNSELENHFLVVGWDQRNSVKSYSRSIDPKSLTIDQYVCDLKELIQYLKKRFNQEKVFLIGESWGTAIGTLYASRYPSELFAYIGISQYANIQKSLTSSLQFAINEAEKRNHSRALRKLKQIGEPGKSYRDVIEHGKWILKFKGALVKHSTMMTYSRQILSMNEYAWPDVLWSRIGQLQSFKALWPEIYKIDFFKQVPELDVPVCFMLGRHDQLIPPADGEQYFNSLKAPTKKLIWFENSAHLPHFEESKRFNEEMIALKHSIIDSYS